MREKHGLAYSIYSSLSFFDDVGEITISAGIETDKLQKSLKLITREMHQLAKTAPSVLELRRARDYLIGQLDLSLEGTENQMMWMGEQLLGYGKVVPAAEIKRRLAEVKASQIRAIAQVFFRPERLSLALVSPLKNIKGLANLLK